MLIALILIVAAVPLALFALLVVGIRMQIPAILNAVRRFNRAVTNPRVMTTAGTASTSTAVIHHTGRNSGRAYETPVEAFDTHEKTVLILLPYGANADWVRNVIARGGAELVRAGETLRLTDPRVVRTAEVRTQLPAKELRMQRVFNVPDCLQLSRP
ncbi:nitroreductase family deazaflavin-dependent oxidoreductase [Mycobacteroides chelonae]|uniref:Nitroreductase family deazaflavin-dependent oxidoreductase n=1 Tax=Mycobacteroides chelonae TaxID=1774 RepID=A0AB73N859_MYCCH|nr:nitroreductase family deazaflavin-dependent oxidoreductase [Mycobacteroides chelonae]SKN90467.1 deazaflavin-dependent nitroreductase family protein [Mycobacteroides abscessus subsp. bolletii]MEC4835193.1 nitroreductase family deazaflavin-dependent oxidoreductase [Mycobacteroides chelonae]MEC4855952.1 nitroreductase family deazaflavin-dependent oxidoreductase [Mycobacteroides chelonae]MEC4872379.1 nitroreductase family deazaflavin-dependent oxidoreductase [Mycobacteroides chelonae]MEC4902347